MLERHAALVAIVEEIQPYTVHQAFYQAEVRGVVPKTEAGYDMVQRALVHIRRDSAIPFDSIVDNTRWQRKPTTYAPR